MESKPPDLETVAGRIAHFVDLAFNGDLLAFAVAAKCSQSTAYNWTNGDSQPKASAIAQLHEIGADARWVTVGVGEMFSDTERGRELARIRGMKVAKVAGAKPTENDAEAILRDLKALVTKHEKA